MSLQSITDEEFIEVQRWVYEAAGISLGPSKKALVCGRWAKRMAARECASVAEYLNLLAHSGDKGEWQRALDLLTTNETYFFREPKHFDFLASTVLAGARRGQALRVWSAACSSGEEPYSLAMLLAHHLGDGPWEIVATDISTRVLARAQTAVYTLERTKDIPKEYLYRYCLKGTGPHANEILIKKELRQHVRFVQTNLNGLLPALGEFDVVFLRNVMIYFDVPTKVALVKKIVALLKPCGFLVIGHSESLNGVSTMLHAAGPSIYQKPA